VSACGKGGAFLWYSLFILMGKSLLRAENVLLLAAALKKKREKIVYI
jgi:hypothetical protein